MIEQFLSNLSDKGIHFERNGDRLKIHASKETLTPDLVSAIKERKAEILQFLGSFVQKAATIRVTPREGHPPLSFAQQRLWFLDQMSAQQQGEGDHLYNMGKVFQFEGTLNLEALEQAAHKLSQRHENLRTNFKQVDNQPVQIIHPQAKFHLIQADGTSLCDTQQRQFIHKELAYPFDLEAGCLWRVTVLGLGEDRGYLIINMHHIISDGWSIPIFMQELLAFYQEVTLQIPAQIPELPIQYADFAQWQQLPEQQKKLDAQANWWKAYLAGANPVHQLPLDRPRPKTLTYRGTHLHRTMDSRNLDAMESLTQSSEMTSFMVFLAAFKVLLHHYSQEEDIIVGTPIANRSLSELEGLIGFFVNSLTIRSQVDSNKSFSEFLGQVRENTLQIYANQDIPFDQVVNLLNPERHLNHLPLFQIAFTHGAIPIKEVAIPGLQLRELDWDLDVSKFDLSLNVLESSEGTQTRWEYNTDLFDSDTIHSMAQHYQNLLHKLLSQPNEPMNQLDLADGGATHALMDRLNQTSCSYPLDQVAHVHFEAQVAKAPNHAALILADQDTDVSYAALNQKANQWAHLLRSRGVKHETRVVLLAKSSVELVVGLLAIFKAGAIAVPLDPDTAEQRLAHMLTDSGAGFILHKGSLPANLPEVPVVDLSSDLADPFPTHDLKLHVDPQQVAFMIYTSGSTGKPKASMNTHIGLVNHHLWMQIIAPMSATDRMVLKTTVGFDAAMWEILTPLMFGAQVVLGKQGLEGDPFELHTILATQAITHIFFVPSVLRALLDQLDNQPMACQIRHLFCGGELVLPQDHQRSLKLLHNSQQSLQFYNIYGPSECAITAITHACDPEPGQTLPPIGKPHGNMQAFITNKQLEMTPAGMPGELVLAGAGLSRGYANRPALTALKFVPHPFAKSEPGSRLYRTGDLARLKRDQQLQFVSRIDHQIKLRGMRIELGEIEACIASHEHVAQVAVVVNQSPTRGQRLVAYLKPTSQASQSLETDLKAKLIDALPKYMVPQVIVFLEELPRLASGKIARPELARRSLDHLLNETASYRPAESDLEKTLAEIWQEVLGVDRVGLDDNFFEIGGHSLLATQVISRVRESLRRPIPLQQIFKSPTLGHLAAWLEAEASVTDDLLLEIAKREDTPPTLSFAQERLWFIDQLTKKEGRATGTYNIHATLKITGPMDLDALQQAISLLEERHEILRTNFQDEAGKPMALIRHQPAIQLQREDFRQASDEARQQRLVALCQAGFDLAADPLMRFHALHLGDDVHVLNLCMHHIISDGWSMTLLVEELMHFYKAVLDDGSASLAPLPIQYADFAAWQKSPAVADAWQQQANWWQETLAHLPPLHQIPTDRPRPSIQSQNGSSLLVPLDAEASHGIAALAQKTETTPFMVLLASFQSLIAKYSGTGDIAVGTPIANRNHKAIEPLIGFFVNTLVLRSQIDFSETFLDLLSQVKRHTLESYDRQDIPFERIVDLLQPVRDNSHAPLFQIMFSLQNMPSSHETVAALTLEPIAVETQSSKFDLHLDIVPNPNGWHCTWHYNTDLFDTSTIETMGAAFRILLNSILAAPNQPLSNYAFGDKQHTIQRLQQLNDTDCDYGLEDGPHIHFQRQAAVRPDHKALILGQETRFLTYGELNQRANQWAWKLLEMGTNRETRIALVATSSAEMVTALMAIFKIGAAAVPLDLRTPAPRLLEMLADSGSALILSQGGDPPEGHGLPVLKLDDESLETYGTNNPNVQIFPDQVAFLIYTSGSTGKPKASMNTYRGLVNHSLWFNKMAPMGLDSRMVNKTTIGFDAALWECVTPLMFGGQVVIGKPGLEGDPFELRKVLETQGVTHIFFVTSVLRSLLDHLGEETLHCQLQHLFCGGEAVLPSDHQRVLNQFENSDHTLHFYNVYGPSECAITILKHHCGDKPLLDFPPIGQPHGNTRVYLADHDLQPVSMGLPGELLIAGAQLSRGYENRPALTAQKFIPNPFDDSRPGSRLYRSGDLTLLKADNLIYFMSRIDHQVKLRGMRIELGEIEAVFAAHEAVAQAAVVVHQSPQSGQRLVGYFTANGQPDAEIIAQIKAEMSDSLPAYMVPHALIALEQMPTLPNGKIARPELASRAVDFGKAGANTTYRKPQSPTEKALAAIWSDVLEVERIGLDDNFFELGGHSLLATQVVSRIRTRFHTEMPLQQLFAQPTLKALADFLDLPQGSQSLANIPTYSRETNELPLSFAQQRLWFIDQLTQNQGVSTGTYNIYLAFKVTGALDLGALQEALHQLETRHEILRTNFKDDKGKPRQIIRSEASIKILSEDVSTLSDSQVEAIVARHCQKGFVLDDEPLLRLHVLNRDESHHVLVLNMHHIISDGWSIGILVRELIGLYNQAAGKGLAPLDPLPIQYADFATWQRSSAMSEELERQAQWWQDQLADLPVVHQIPTDRPRPRLQTQNGDSLVMQLDQETTQALESLVQASGGTIFMGLLAAFQYLISKYSAQSDIVVGTPIANRNRAEIEPLIGFFVNTLVLRTQVDGVNSFRQFLAQVVAQTLKSYDHQDIPFEKIVDLLQPERNPSHTPLFQIMFSLQNAPTAAIDLPHLHLEPLSPHTQSVKFDLHLDLVQTQHGLTGSWQFNTDLFNQSTIHTMSKHFKELLAAFVANPDLPMAQIQFLDPSTRHKLISEWGHQPWKNHPSTPAHGYFEYHADLNPDHIALVIDGDRPDMTYGALNQKANRCAWGLLEAGLKPETRVALLAKGSPELLVGLLAILKAGGVVVPMDPQTPAHRLKQMLDDSDAAFILGQSQWVAPIENHHVRCFDDPSIYGNRTDNPPLNIGLDHAAFLIYTSGSTGVAKASINTHLGLVNHNLFVQKVAPMGDVDRILYKTPMSFDVAMWETLWPLMVGAQLVIGPEGIEGDPFTLRRLIKDHRITHIFFVPSMLRAFLDSLGSQVINTHLKQIFTAGEALLPQDQQRVIQLIQGPTGPVKVRNHYGPSEAAISVTSYACAAEPHLELIPMGRPNGNVCGFVVDQHLQLIPPGIQGEFVVGGQALSRGYQGRARLTATKFVPNPFSTQEPGSRLYLTGDVARQTKDGQFLYLGRTDHQIKLRGMRIELGEIEAHLHDQAQIEHACVVLANNQKGEKGIVAFLKTSLDASESMRSTLRHHLQSKMPRYMVPSIFIKIENWPLLSSGKINYKKLQTMAESHFSQGTSATPYAPPTNETQKVLCHIWQDILGLEKVGIHDHFFEIGGHSLLATQIISRVRDAFQIEIPLQSLFEAPSVAKFAPLLEEQTHATVSAIPVVSREKLLPLSSAQARFWFLYKLEGPTSTYNMPIAFKVSGRLDREKLEKAYTEIVARHENLRTNIRVIQDKAQLHIQAATPQKIDFLDIRSTPLATKESQANALREQHGLASFDLETGPLHRMTCVQLADHEFMLLLNMHHIISDGWSQNQFMQEMVALYRAFSLGEASPLAPLTVQYADYASWQQEHLESPLLHSQIQYWQKQLGSDLKPLALPTDYRRPAIRTFTGAQLSCQLDPETSDTLVELASQSKATLFMALLSGFYHLLARYSGSDDIAIGTPIAGRSRSETEPLIGVFLNTLVLRTQLAGEDLTFGELLARVRQVTLEAYAHQEVPFEKLLEVLNPERDLSRTPLFQVFFNMVNLPKLQANPLEDLSIEQLGNPDVGSKFDLTLYVVHLPTGGLSFQCHYNADLFEATRMQHLLEQYCHLLRQIAGQPERPLAHMSLITEAAAPLLPNPKQPLSKEWHGPVFQNLAQIAQEHPHRIAIQSPTQEYTYEALEQLTNQFAHLLIQHGVTKGSPVAIYAARCPDLVIAMVGTLKAGATMTILDPAYPEARLKDYCDLIKPTLLVELQEAGEAPASLHSEQVLRLPTSSLASMPTHAPKIPLQANEPALITFTSGSTGKPKGIVGRHGSLTHFTPWLQESFNLASGDRFSMLSALAHDPLQRDVFTPLWIGATLCIPQAEAMGPDALFTWMAEQKITVANLAPIMIRLLGEGQNDAMLPAFRLAFTVGDALTHRDASQLQAMAPEVNIVNLYGTTETQRALAYDRINLSAAGPHRDILPLGKGMPDVQLLILNPCGELSSVGELGEIYVRSPHIALGYFKQPDLTEAKFLDNPFSPDEKKGLYRTGDLGYYLPDGRVAYSGRVDHQVQVRGYRIELAEIEAMLLSHDAIHQAAVVAHTTKNSDVHLVAFLQGNGLASELVQTAKIHLQERMPRFMVPSYWHALEALPILPSGKLDRQGMSQQPLPRSTMPDAKDQAKTDTEKALVAIWQEVLKLEGIGIHESFFDLGGNSLLAMQIHTRMIKTFQETPRLQFLFEEPTIFGVAKAIDAIRKIKMQPQPSSEEVEIESFDF